jgi:hypothetical protein
MKRARGWMKQIILLKVTVIFNEIVQKQIIFIRQIHKSNECVPFSNGLFFDSGLKEK